MYGVKGRDGKGCCGVGGGGGLGERIGWDVPWDLA